MPVVSKQQERKLKKDTYKSVIQIMDIKRCPLKGSNNTYEHVATLKLEAGLQPRFFVCFVEAGRVKDALFDTKHIKDTADKAMKKYLVEAGKITPSLYVEEVLFIPKGGEHMGTWLTKIQDTDLWTALVETIVSNSAGTDLEQYQVRSGK